MKTQNTLFKKGDKVVHIHESTFKGTVTKVKYVPKKGLIGNEYQWLWLDGSDTPCGSTSEYFKLDESEQPKHTFGELVVMSEGQMAQGRWGGIEKSIMTEGKIVIKTFGKTKEEAETNAQRIVKAVNMHDKLIDGIIEAQRILGELSGKDCEAINFSQEFLYGSYQKLKLLLKESENK